LSSTDTPDAPNWGPVAGGAPAYAVFQDSFGMSRAISYRLGRIAALTSSSAATDANQTAADAVAEIRPWAGTGSVLVETPEELGCTPPPPRGGPPGPKQSPQPTVVLPPGCYVNSIVLAGYVPEDLGVSSLDAASLASVLAFTNDAECALGLRKDCASNAVSIPIAPNQINTTDPTNIVVTLPVKIPLPRYIVSTRSAKGSQRNFIAPLLAGEAYQDAPMRRDLLNAMFDFADGGRSHDPRVGDPGAATPNSYCIPGVRRDAFVPLSNELTADGSQFEDSWRSYLTVAQQAAQRADDIAQQIIQVGTQQDTRREQAAQQLGQLCGDISALDQVGVKSNGTLDTSSAEGSLQQCLGEPRYDVVFLSDFVNEASIQPGGPLNVAALQGILGCTSSSSDAVCDKLSQKHGPVTLEVCHADGSAPPDLGSANVVTLCSLNLFKSSVPTPSTAPSLNDVRPVVTSRQKGFDPSSLATLYQKAWTEESSLHATTYGLQLTVNADASWNVTSGDFLMNSQAPDPNSHLPREWPACLRGTYDCPPGSRQELFNDVFRSAACSGGGNKCVLGAGFPVGEQAELNALRWRVEGALWALGMLGGGVPEATFQTPVPAIDFSAVAGAPYSAQLGTIYGLGYFDPSGYLNTLDPQHGSTEEDQQALGATTGAPLGFLIGSGTSGMYPAWYADIYSEPHIAYYRHITVPVATPAGSDAGAFAGVIGVQNAEEPAANASYSSPSYAIEAVRGLDGALCAGYEGGFAIPSTNQPATVIAHLARIKANWARADRMQATGNGGRWFTPDGDGYIQWTDNNTVFEKPYLTGGVDQPPGFTSRLDETSKDRPLDVTCRDPYAQNQRDPNDVTIALCASVSPFGAYAGDGRAPYYPLNTSVLSEPPDRRVRDFVNSGPAADGCSALSELIGAYVVAAAAGEMGQGALPQSLPPAPPLNNEGDMGRFQRWLATLEAMVKDRAAKDYSTGVPARAVQDQRSAHVAQGSLAGDHGGTIVGIENGLGAVGSDWVTLANALDDLNRDFGKTRAVVTGLDQQTQARVNGLGFALAQAINSDVTSIVQGIGDLFKGPGGIIGGAGAITGSAVDIALQIGAINDEIHATRDQNANAVYQQLLDLAKQASDTVALLEKTLTSLRADLNTVSKLGDQLRAQEDQGAYLAAQGLGADYVTTANGTTTAIPLNTVLRRQYDGLSLRYKEALTEAKGLAFLARRAIEQRVGVSMSDMHDAVGPLDPPATWADSVCHMTGIDYATLRSIGANANDGGEGGVTLEPASGDGGLDQQQIQQFADGFIGDYVSKLQNFVDYYNVQYPSHQSDDIAILSLREDFLPRQSACMTRGSNLAHYSSQLWHEALGDPQNGGTPGWEYTPCLSTAKCLFASQSVAAPDAVPPEDAVRAHVTLLADQALPASTGKDGGPPALDASAGDAGGDASASGDPRGRVNTDGPPGFVSQTVNADAGSYVLSWWDQARHGYAGAYRVVVFDASWNAIARWSDVAFDPGDSSTPGWSDRRVVAFDLPAAGTIHLAFAASGTDGTLGAVGVSGVQLEKTANGGSPTAYVETSVTLDSYTAICPAPSAQALQGAFTRRCDDPTGACYYEIDAPFVINSVGLQNGTSPLAGKIARGNFNYRHVNLAINLAGTGVRSCPDGSSPSCYGTGYTEYSLYHDAEQVPILDWNGTPHYFDFETGRIEHGKALAAERYITLPIGSADQSLLSQPEIEKVELQGRPLDGPYRLRIWDDPALHWSQLQDVQIIVQYRYWSKVDSQTPPSSP
jgi:hypothetical protein